MCAGGPFFCCTCGTPSPWVSETLFGGLSYGPDFGPRHIHVQTPVPCWPIEVVETVLDVDDVLTPDQDVVDVGVVASAGICPGGGAGGGTPEGGQWRDYGWWHP